MLSLGSALREGREKNYLKIEEVSKTTRIKYKYIEAMETENIHLLPQRVYTIGFLKNLASLYGINYDFLVASYDALLNNTDISEMNSIEISKMVNLRASKATEAKNNAENENYQRQKITSSMFDNTLNNVDDDMYSSSYGNPSIFDSNSVGVSNEINKNILNNDLKEYTDSFIHDKESFAMRTKVEREAYENSGLDYQTSSIVSEFEQLIKDEVEFETQRIKKQNMNTQITSNKKSNKYKKEKQEINWAMVALIGLVIVIMILLIMIIPQVFN